ncbi:MAG: hypothetical protein KIT31_18705 [Deltaproteobacteria bacterium]|nr:hypothetical protein [Deltaproteobacteria bacterium]
MSDDDHKRLEAWHARAEERARASNEPEPARWPAGFVGRLGATLREPLAWIGAAGVGAATMYLDGAGEWLAGVLARALPADAVPRYPGALPDQLARGDAPGIVTWIGVTIAASLVGALLAAATLGAGQRGRAEALLHAGWTRLLRTRVTLLPLVGIGGGLLAAGLATARPQLGAAADVGLAAVMAIAGGWAALADRFALARFDARQDARASEVWSANHNAPYYLDTSAPRGRIADGTDRAVTDAGKRLLTAGGLGAMALTATLAVLAALAPRALRPSRPPRRRSRPPRSAVDRSVRARAAIRAADNKRAVRIGAAVVALAVAGAALYVHAWRTSPAATTTAAATTGDAAANLGPATPPDLERFTLDAAEVATGAAIAVAFPGPMIAAPGEKYWIAVVAREAPDTEYGTWKYLEPGARTSELVAPKQAGSYEVRLHANYPTRNTHVVHRAPITVR